MKKNNHLFRTFPIIRTTLVMLAFSLGVLSGEGIREAIYGETIEVK